MPISLSSYYSLAQAAEYLSLRQQSISAAIHRGSLVPDLRRGKRPFFLRRTLDAYRRPLLPPVPQGYISTSELLNQCLVRNKRGARLPRSNSSIICYLTAAGVPKKTRHSSCNTKHPIFFWHEEEAWNALAHCTTRSHPSENHLLATPDILTSSRWVTCARAARICGCATVDISSRAAKYSIKSYLHPRTGKLLVDWRECMESIKWRTAVTIKKHMGSAGLSLVKRTCESRRIIRPCGITMLYRVPELVGANLPPTARDT